ncbi:DNA internalization-related competence protein ComEC/Rec2 [Ferrimonas gelatinilytica]|uniref:DNA internalization-related competence protein ComEC/Rec2 n=1 Tax=Ferrimonas gelatinilytica TaxID=1255257 RepID=A0ABP9S062_9GAMM
MVNGLLLGWVAALTLSVVWPLLLPISVLMILTLAAAVWGRIPFLIGIGLGLCWGQGYAHWLTSPDRALAAGYHEVIARVTSAPVGDALYQRTHFRVERFPKKSFPWHEPRQLELSWYNGPTLSLGERYRLLVKLKDPDGSGNLGGHNGRRHRLAQGITAIGYVREGELLTDPGHWRRALMARLEAGVEALPRGDLIRALMLADKRGISQERWQQLRRSGLIHLMAVSGLHLSIVAGLVLALGYALMPRIWPDPRGRGRVLVWWAAGLAALGYALLAGFALPTQRALLMVLLGMLLLWLNRNARPWEVLLRVAALVLLFQPLAAMAPGYWLSFGAVGLILLFHWLGVGFGGQRLTQRLLSLFLLQGVITLGLFFLQGAWFGEATLHGLWANLLLLPLFSVLLLPLCLLAAGSYLLGAPQEVLLLADWALWPLELVAHWAAALPWGAGGIPQAILLPGVMLLMAAALVWLRPWRGWGWQAAILVLPFALLLQRPEPEWRIDVIDVGQGLAVLVQRQEGALLYDTGAGFASGFSYAQSAILPLLRERGVEALEWLVVSHGDQDHRGGVDALRETIPVGGQVGFGGRPCLQGPSHWRGLDLHWYQYERAGNDGSCVLVLSDGQRRVLLPGDIERGGEAHLLAQGVKGPFELLLAPHHGSSTSSSAEFVDAMQPNWVVYAAGRVNRWGFPHPEVEQRYRALGSRTLHTGRLGQLEFRFDEEAPTRFRSYRQQMAPWWYNRQLASR